MASTLALDGDRIRSLVAKADSGGVTETAERLRILDVLEQHECWGPFFRLLGNTIAESPKHANEYFVRLARVQNKYLEDAFAAAETCANLVAELQVSYLQFSVDMLPQVIDFEDFNAEGTVLSAICDFLPTAADQISCLERLCMLYEKKIHNESRLVATYEKLLQVDPSNVRALRYFKLTFTQSNDWDQVVDTLKKLLVAVRKPQELFRVAQELAAIYLYQLDMPSEAIQTLEIYCSDSPLDTSTILFDAYQRLADWQGCLRVLRQCLLNVEAEGARAILHQKIAVLNAQIGATGEALDNFTKAVKISPPFLDAIEGIVNLAIQRKDWPLVEQWLGHLADAIIDDRLRIQVQQAQGRLRDGLAHANQQ
ncbi:MAG: hypothetical protein NTY08_05710 [Proteobacteria bacterium]|nr:hypothetical protein [Pseudomonadota bacterium]